MKTQMRVQKILMLVSLVVSALVFVYALFFMTGGLANVYRFVDTVTKEDYINCSKFVSTADSFVSTLVAFGIVMVVLVAVMYLMACNSRRKYYITNYIAVGLFVVFAVVVAIYLVAMVATVMDLYQNDICWESGTGEVFTRIEETEDDYIVINVFGNYADQAQYYPSYKLDPNQTYNFVIGFILFVIVLADAVCVALCTVWKFFLIKGENKLLAQGAPVTADAAEVAVADATENAAEEVVSEEAPAAEAEGDNPVKEEE